VLSRPQWTFSSPDPSPVHKPLQWWRIYNIKAKLSLRSRGWENSSYVTNRFSSRCIRETSSQKYHGLPQPILKLPRVRTLIACSYRLIYVGNVRAGFSKEGIVLVGCHSLSRETQPFRQRGVWIAVVSSGELKGGAIRGSNYHTWFKQAPYHPLVHTSCFVWDLAIDVFKPIEPAQYRWSRRTEDFFFRFSPNRSPASLDIAFVCLLTCNHNYHLDNLIKTWSNRKEAPQNLNGKEETKTDLLFLVVKVPHIRWWEEKGSGFWEG